MATFSKPYQPGVSYVPAAAKIFDVTVDDRDIVTFQ
jgi:hypothetical protein